MTGPNRSSRPILVTGAHRTGTTWVGKMLSAAPGIAYISEPLNVLHRPGVMRAPVRYWYTYISEANEQAYLPAFQETIALRYHLIGEIASLRSAKDVGRMLRDARHFLARSAAPHRPLLKDPFAVFSALWFARRLNCQVVITVRHPAAFASSLKRLNWPFDFTDLLDQPALMRDHLEPYRSAMQAALQTPQDIIGQAALLWQMVYATTAKFQREGAEICMVRHEDLSLDPAAGFRDLYRRLGLEYTPQVRSRRPQFQQRREPRRAVQTRRSFGAARQPRQPAQLEAPPLAGRN